MTGSSVELHLIDGTYELFRAHFSKRPERADPEGRDVKATVGIASSLLGLLADQPDEVAVAVAFDNPIESFRNDRFEGYKDSTGVDPELLAQFDRAEEAVAALGIVVWSVDEHEADDALATAAVRWADDVDRVVIHTPDKDLCQVVRGDRIVQYDRRNDRFIDAGGVVERFGVRPESIPDYLALVGDTADGIPGLPGFGAKTSAALLGRYGHLEAIPTDPADWDVEVRGATRLGATLVERAADARLYRELATLVTDVPLAEELDALRWGGVPRQPYLAWCERIGSESLRDRPSRWARDPV